MRRSCPLYGYHHATYPLHGAIETWRGALCSSCRDDSASQWYPAEPLHYQNGHWGGGGQTVWQESLKKFGRGWLLPQPSAHGTLRERSVLFYQVCQEFLSQVRILLAQSDPPASSYLWVIIRIKPFLSFVFFLSGGKEIIHRFRNSFRNASATTAPASATHISHITLPRASATLFSYSRGRVISRNPPVPADKQIAHRRGHSEESAYYPSFWKSAYYPSSKLQPEILQCSYLPRNPQNWNLLITGPFLRTHGFDDPYLRKFLGFGGVRSRSHFGHKEKNWNLLITGPFLGTHGFDNPYFRKFLGFGGVISRLHFGHKEKIEICLLEVLFLGPMVLIILILGNSWGSGV